MAPFGGTMHRNLRQARARKDSQFHVLCGWARKSILCWPPRVPRPLDACVAWSVVILFSVDSSRMLSCGRVLGQQSLGAQHLEAKNMSFMFAHRKRGYPLHDAAEVGDLQAIKNLLHPPPPPPPVAAAEGGEPSGDAEGNGEMMQVDEKGEDAEGANDEGEGVEGEEEEEEEESVDSEDDEDYEESGAEDDEEGMDEDEEGMEGGMLSEAPRRMPAIDVNSRDNEDCTALHVAIHARQLEAARLLLEEKADVVRTTEKSTVLHTAVSLAAFPQHREFTLEAIKLLAEYKVEIDARDDNLQTALHLAAHIGHEDTIQLLLDKGATESIAGRDRYKQTPLHLAAKAGHLGSVRLLTTAGADPLLRDFFGRTPLHMASRNGHWEVVEEMLQGEKGAEVAKVKDKQGLTAGDLAVKRGVSVPMRLAEGLRIEAPPTEEPVAPPTLLVTDAACLDHHTCPPISRSSLSEPPPENVNRLKVLLNPETGSLRASEFEGCEWLEEARPAALADLLKCHELHYLERVKQTCLSLDREEEELGQLDGDTTISNGTWEAALRAAGATCMAVDRVVEGRNKNAFCAVRPPGHHAGSRGVVTDDPAQGSHGFCLINNVAVAAAYARTMYRHKGIARIAIVDFDVHHGNGTEEIVENLVPHTEEVSHKLPWADEVSYSRLKYLPWLNEDDAKETLFISVHGYSGSFYPGTGRTKIPPVDGFVEEEKDSDTDDDPFDGKPPVQVLDVGMRRVMGEDVLPGQNRVEWRTTMRGTVLPRLAAFAPDLILISAGFDAHRRDTINHGFIGLVEEDYEWITDYLVRIANKSCEGRVVSVLEGGYRIQGGVVSPFARSVAAHVRSLVAGRTSKEAFESSDLEWEHAYEKRLQDERLKKLIEQKAAMEAARELAREAAIKAAREEAANETAESSPDVAVGSAAPAETDAPSTATEDTSGRRSKRKAAAPVDYVALAKKLKEEEAEAAKGAST